MTYLLDTNIVSATRRLRLNPIVARWIRNKAISELWISTFTIGEIQQGIVTQPDLAKRAEVSEWLAELRFQYRDRLLPFGTQEAMVWGSMTGPMHSSGHPPGTVDSMIAATAIVHGLRVVTRNVRHFEPFDVPIVNPWTDENGV